MKILKNQISIWFVALALSLVTTGVMAEDDYLTVTIVEPYIDIHSGPGVGYPILHVAEQNQKIKIIKQHTNWYKVRTFDGKEGWTIQQQLAKTLTGDNTVFADLLEIDGKFGQRSFEFGVNSGVVEGASALGMFAAWQFTENLAAELHYTQALGNVSESKIGTIEISHQPFLDWRFSPYVAIGAGVINTKPRTPLIGSGNETRNSDILSASIGVKTYLMRNFVLTLEYKSLHALTTRDKTEELELWKAGFSVFF